MKCVNSCGILRYKSPNLGQTTKLDNSQKKKKRTCRIEDFAFPVEHRVKLKESKNKDKYPDPARELKKNEEHLSNSDTNCNWCS